MLAALASLTSVYLLIAGCTTTSTTTTTASSPATSGSESPKADGKTETKTTTGGDANPVTVGMQNSDRKDADPLELIQSDQLKTELAITPEQSTKLKTVENDLRTKMTKRKTTVEAELKGITDSKAKEEKLKSAYKEIDAETKSSRDSISTILKPDQLKRLKEVFLSIYGFGPLNYKDYQTELKLTDTQSKQLETLSEQLQTSMRTSWETSEDPTKSAEILTKNKNSMQSLIKGSNDKAMQVLTAEQKKTLDTLKGKPFTFKPSKAA
jgi:Spy/CpxP family protein refolding chaperone